MQAAKTTALMVGALLVCYLPLVVKWHICGLNSPVFSIVSQVCIDDKKCCLLGLYSQALVATNSFMNPFIYAMKIPAFKSRLMGYIRRVEPDYSDSGFSMEERRKSRVASYSTTISSGRGGRSFSEASKALGPQ